MREANPAESIGIQRQFLAEAAERPELHKVEASIAELETLIGAHFPDSLNPLKVALAVIAVACIGDHSLPTTLIFVGPPSAGKGLALSFVMPGDKNDILNRYLYRSDKFTAASFVSHRADMKPKQLADVDLLPKIRDKTLVTKELSPFFRGKRFELEERFSMLTSVLDGQGFISDSGAQGRRGYQHAINFQWLGATTPLSEEAHEIMANLGPRMVFYSADRPRKATDELMELLRDGDQEAKREQCQDGARRFVECLFQTCPPGSIKSRDFIFSDERLRRLVLWARTLVALRALVGLAEQPERVLMVLRNIACGSALIHGRLEVNDYDLAQIGHVCMSSGIANRQKVFRAVLQSGGGAATPQIERLAGLSTPTALKYMRELEVVELARFADGSPCCVELLTEYQELSTPTLNQKEGERLH
jgi:hypothetical protein